MSKLNILRANSTLRRSLGTAGVQFLLRACGTFERILPHVQTSSWQESKWAANGAVWDSPARTRVRVTLAIGDGGDQTSRSLKTTIERRRTRATGGQTRNTIDNTEFDICALIAERISEIALQNRGNLDAASLKAISNEFDEFIVAKHIQSRQQLQALSAASVFDAFHALAEQSYENKALTFGCLLDSRVNVQPSDATFPASFLSSKKYKALSDGFRTAYQISRNGAVVNFLDLDTFGGRSLRGQHFFPDWAEAIARASHAGRCGIALSRQGELLVFYDGTLRFTFRHGQWQYWNHGYLVHLLRDVARAQRVPTQILERVVRKLYRMALDISFRRSGGLFLILRNRNSMRATVRVGDAIGDHGRNTADMEFDKVVQGRKVQALPGAILVELASLDGAIVLDNSGLVRAYGAVLQPKKRGRVHTAEGSRTKAAIGASNYGLAVKISSDGDITAYHLGEAFLKV